MLAIFIMYILMEGFIKWLFFCVVRRKLLAFNIYHMDIYVDMALRWIRHGGPIIALSGLSSPQFEMLGGNSWPHGKKCLTHWITL